MLSNYNRIYFDEENKFVVSFTPKEWDEISKFISAKTRAYFLIPFCDKLSLKFQEHGIKCWLKVVYNWFKPDTSQKRNSPYWSGKYICIKKDCGCMFYTKILNKPNGLSNIQMEIQFNKYSNHSLLEKPKEKIKGHNRLQTAIELTAYGIKNYLARNILLNLEEKQNLRPFNSNLLKQIKYEFKHQELISLNLFVDTEASKKLTTHLIPSPTSSNLRGFVQDISMNPYGFILFSHIQVKFL